MEKGNVPPSQLDSATGFRGVTPQPPGGSRGFILLQSESVCPSLGHFAGQRTNTLRGCDVQAARADTVRRPTPPAKQPGDDVCRGVKGAWQAATLHREPRYQGGAAVSGRGTVSPWVSLWSQLEDRYHQL